MTETASVELRAREHRLDLSPERPRDDGDRHARLRTQTASRTACGDRLAPPRQRQVPVDPLLDERSELAALAPSQVPMIVSSERPARVP